MGNYIKWLDEVSEEDIFLVGSKYSNLMEILKIGLNVPLGFCITTFAYQETIKKLNLSDIIRKIDFHDLNSVKDNAEKIKGIITSLEIPKIVEEEIILSYKKLHKENNIAHVAIRSSGTFEDLPHISFAGQYDTYLNVSGIKDLLFYVKKCWASLWNTRALVYRERNKLSHSQALMAIIVQKIVASNKSGVMFTVNPVTNDRGEIFITASWGLGEAIVTGKLTGDEYIVSKANNEIKRKKINTKDIEIIQKPKGTKKIKVDNERKMQQCLSNRQIKKLALIGKKIENHFGLPQDIEWGIFNDYIYIFQSRPITTLYSLKDVLKRELEVLKKKTYDRKILWSNVFLCEAIPRPKPMSWEVFKLFMSKEGSFGLYEREIGLGKVPQEGITDLICSRPYYNLNKLINVFSFYGIPLKPLDFEKLKEDQSQANIIEPRLDTGKYGGKLLLFLMKFMALLPYSLYKSIATFFCIYNIIKNFHFVYDEKILPKYLRYIEKLENKDLKQLSDKELVHEIERLIQSWTRKTTKYHIYSEFCTEISYGLLKALVGEGLATTLLSGIEGNRLTETNIQLWKLSLQASPRIVDVILNNKPDQIQAKLLSTKEGRNYWSKMQQFLRIYGHRTFDEYELSTPRWQEDPNKIYVLIRNYLKAKEVDPIKHFEKQKTIRKELEHNIMSKFSIGVDKIFPLRRKLFKFALKHSQIYSPLRETTKFHHLMEYAQLRRFLIELGSRLAGKIYGALEEENDIFFLVPKELSLVIEGRLNRVQVRNLISRRKEDRNIKLSIQIPPLIFSDFLDKIDGKVAVKATDVLRGIPVSRGRAEGKAKIILSPSEFSNFKEGEILIAPTIDAGWTPLFLTAKAVVMDTGNVSSHGAIVAREFGLPTIVNVKDATKILKDGQEIIVDGDEGKIYLSRNHQ